MSATDTSPGAAASGTQRTAGAADAPAVPAVSAVEQLAGRVDRAITAAAALDEQGRATATELREALEAFHREGLVTIVRALREDDRGRELLFELVDDPRVHALLALHGIIRADPRTRAEEALTSVRPYLQGHGGDVELLGLEGGVAQVRLLGACDGCSMASQTLRNAVEVALVDGVPEIAGIEVVADEQAPTIIDPASLWRRPGETDETTGGTSEDATGGTSEDATGGTSEDATGGTAAPAAGDDAAPDTTAGWVRGPGLLELGDPGVARVDLDGDSFVVVQDGGVVAAFRNACGHLGLDLDDATVGGGRVVCDHHGYQFDLATGAGLTQPGTALTAVPCRVEGVHVWLLPDPT